MTLFYAFKNEKIWDHRICHPARANGKMSLNNQMASHLVKKNHEYVLLIILCNIQLLFNFQ
jgi:hypothetical protein